MNRYTGFLTFFILSFVASIVFFYFYLHAIFSFALPFHEPHGSGDPLGIFFGIFSPQVLLSLLAMAVFSLVYRILGIVYVARNKKVSDGEKALWIVGFLLMGFVTAIVFLVMAKGRGYVD